MLHAKQGVDTAKFFQSQVKEIHQQLEYTHGHTQRLKK